MKEIFCTLLLFSFAAQAGECGTRNKNYKDLVKLAKYRNSDPNMKLATKRIDRVVVKKSEIFKLGKMP